MPARSPAGHRDRGGPAPPRPRAHRAHAGALALALIAGCSHSPATQKLVTVTARDWDATHGTLRRYEGAPGHWRQVGADVPIVLGKSGLAWGRGLHGDGAPTGHAGPVKVEGDGRSTAGRFRLGAAYDHPFAPTWRCVDDPASPRYNTVFDAAGLPEDWRSAEKMGDVPGYRLLVVVEHNSPPRPGAGSCIFLHVWSGPDSTTAGCTAMADADLAALIAWLTPGKTDYVALPESEYATLHDSWQLP